MTKPRIARWLQGLAALALLLPLLAGLTLLFGHNAAQYAAYRRGQESGLAVTQAPIIQPRVGTNVVLERYADEATLHATLAALRAAGIGAVRQRFAWAELEPTPGAFHWENAAGLSWERVLQIVQQEGLQVIAVLDTSPDWARAAWEADNIWAPPVDVADYARFASAFAARYGQLVAAYQVWDQPNIAPHWGAGEVDPAGYVALLHAASAAIRAAQPEARIIAGGLAPNTEPGGRNMSDLLYLREMLRRGAGADFDILGVKAYGFWSGAYDRRVADDLLNFSRVILVREELVRRGQADKAIWALEGGWCALPEGWSGAPAALGNDSPFVQSERLGQALERVEREWPWLGLACLQVAQPDAPPDDPAWGFALLDPHGQPTALYTALLDHAARAPVLYPGLTLGWQALARSTTSTPAVLTDADLVAAPPPQVELRWWGTDLYLLVDQGAADGQLVARLSAQAGDTRIDLTAVTSGLTRVRVGGKLALGFHTLQMEGAPEQLAAIRGVQVGQRPPLSRVLGLIASSLVLVWLLWLTARAARLIPWGAAWGRVSALWHKLPSVAQNLLVVGAFLTGVLCPLPMFRPLLLLLYSLFALLRPDLALLIVVGCIPFAPLTVRLGPGSFVLPEIALLIAVAARLGDALLTGRLRGCRPVAALKRWRLADWAVLGLVALGLATCFVAEYQHVALREWRVVLLEPALLYLLLRTQRSGSAGLLRLTDALWLSGVAVACYALAVYPLPQGVIEAEGVRRARAFYGSPNNLALYLERLLPLGLALGLPGTATRSSTRWRRWLYGLGALPMLAALALTFSRGAWLLGIPAGLLTFAWLRGGRVRYVALALLVVGVIVLVPLARTPRFAGLLDPTQGTTFLRVSLWQAAWDMVREHPWLGVGLDNFLYYYRDYVRPGAEVDRYLSHPHNLELDFWLRLGIGGLAVLGALLIGFVRGVRQGLRRIVAPDARAMLLGLTAGMAAALAHGQIDAAFFVIELAYWFLFALAWVTAQR